MKDDMMFKLKTKSFSTLDIDEKHYLAVDTTMMGSPMRLGDLSMLSCMLFCLKYQLINEQPERFNNDNLFFILNRVGGLLVNDIMLTLSLFPNVWGDIEINAPDWYNVRQLISGGNVWSFKQYLDTHGIKLNDVVKGKHVVDPSHFCISPTNANKQNVFLFPVRNKKYNIERNMSDELLIKIINKFNRPVKLIIKDIPDNFEHVIRSCNNVSVIRNNVSWMNIMLDIMKTGIHYISGDCGLTHLISLVHEGYKPSMEIYYNTKPYHMKKPLNQFDRAATLPIDFKPYSPYLTDITIINQF